MSGNVNLIVRFANVEKLFDFVEDLKAFEVVPTRTAIRQADSLDAGGQELILYGGGDGRELELVHDVKEKYSVALKSEEEA